MKQTHFLNELKVNTKKVYGGNTRGKRKVARPFGKHKWVHLTLTAKKAVGSLSLQSFKNKTEVDGIVRGQAKKHGVQIAEYVNMGNHLHIKLKCTHRFQFRKFMISVPAMIARKVTGANKNKSFGKFWDALAYTRVLITRFEELHLRGYFQANRVQATMGYNARLAFLEEFNAWMKQLRMQT